MAYIYDLSDTWNAAGTTFFGIKMNVTNSASASGSKLLSLQVASTEYFGVDKNGNVTIGNGGDLRISSATGGDDSIIYNDAEDLYFNTNGAVRAVVNSSGNVGIGTSSPQSRFHVDVPAGGGSFFTGTGNYNGGYPTAVFGLNIGYNFQAGAADVDFFNSWTGATGAQGGFSFRRQTGASSQTSLMRIDGSGNLLVGSTSAPSGSGTNLQVANSGAARLWLTSTGYRNFYLESSSGNALQFIDGTAGSERMRIDSSGNVGIGTSSPKTRLQASAATTKNAPTLGSATDAPFYLSNSDTAYGLVIGNSSADGRVWFQAQRTDSSATAYNITLNEAGGQVLVGTASTFDNVSYLKFQSLGGVSTKIAGTSLTSQMSFFNDNGRVGWIGTDGTTTSYNTSSDARLKENIANADDASSLIDAIQVRKFDWKADGSHQRYGFIAQELIEVAPEAVSAPPEEDQMMAVDYSKLVPMLVKELQSLRARVAQLEGN